MKKKQEERDVTQPATKPEAMTLEDLAKVSGGNGTWGEFPQWASPPPAAHGGGGYGGYGGGYGGGGYGGYGGGWW